MLDLLQPDSQEPDTVLDFGAPDVVVLGRPIGQHRVNLGPVLLPEGIRTVCSAMSYWALSSGSDLPPTAASRMNFSISQGRRFVVLVSVA